jgi:hypothetical protein
MTTAVSRAGRWSGRPCSVYWQTFTLRLLQEGVKVSGLYKCGYGNMDCRNGNETGKVALGTMGTNILQMRVMMPDGSDCMFNGRPKGDAIEGRYLCLQGGGLIERGIWRARRSY